MALAGWLVLVAGVPLLVRAGPAESPAPGVAALPLSALATAGGEQVVALPAGFAVPLRVDLDSALLAAPPSAALTLSLNRSIEIALRDGQPDGRYRLSGGPWRRVGDHLLNLRIDRISPQLVNGAAEIRAHARFDTNDPDQEGNR